MRKSGETPNRRKKQKGLKLSPAMMHAIETNDCGKIMVPKS
jgi:hypothetical protein